MNRRARKGAIQPAISTIRPSLPSAPPSRSMSQSRIVEVARHRPPARRLRSGR